MPTINQRAALAAGPDTAASILRELASDASPKVREAVASNPATPADALETLVADPKPMVRWAVATNPSPLARPIAIAASDAHTRELAATRGDLDPEDLRRLVNDPVRSVRLQVANVTTDAELARRLARDPDPRMRAMIIHNHALPDAEVERLAHDPVASVRSSAAASRRLRPETLTTLATDKSAVVRWHLLVNNPERIDLARVIAEDPDEMNSDQAKAQLESPRQFTAFLGPIDLVE
ncbi:hypothetical protein [Agromyces arachidis]|uniref:hypothetical protein n=1 Tax=Agromyces arachidis TaxID=766966 RepID=UPI004057325B